MPLSGQVLGQAIIAAVQAPPDAQPKILAMAEAIVQHFITNAVVTVPITGTVIATGAMAGGPGVPCAGTATGTVG
jgi:hypothetical protein